MAVELKPIPAVMPESMSVGRRILVLAAIVLSSACYTSTVVIATAILPQMQGAMAATEDEISWTVTFNILATAVVTPMTGWMSARFGRRNIMLWSMMGFSVASFFCGWADTLESAVFWRILQGGLGAPLIPLAQAILLDVFPKPQHGKVIATYGMALVVGPALGPALGGYVAEAYSWRWAYYMVVPAGLLAHLSLYVALPRDDKRKEARLDWVGFLSLTVAITCMQLVFSRGQRLDWFESPEIILEACIGVVAFYMFIAHSLTAKQPFLNLRLLLNRNYAIGLALVFIYGMLQITPMVLLPPLLRSHVGFTDGLIGLVVSGRGVGAIIGFFLAMFSRHVDPRLSMIAGAGLQVASGLWLMSVDLNVDLNALLTTSLMQGIAVGIIWVPLTVVTFATLDPKDLAETSATFHLLRYLGTSFFVSICVAEVVRATGVNYGRMTELVTPFNEVLSLPWARGLWSIETVPDLARLSKEISRQAAMIGYLNAFGMYTAMSAASIPLILLVSTRARGNKPDEPTAEREPDPIDKEPRAR